MTRYDDDDEGGSPQRRRDNMMERRLRKARGEDIPEEEFDVADDDLDYDYPEMRRPYGRPIARPPQSGCAQAALYTTLGAIAVLLIAALFARQVAAAFGGALGGMVPNIQAIVNTPTPVIRTGAAVVQRIQQLNRLETTSYTIERVVDVSQGSPLPIPLIGDALAGDKLLLIANGTVVAGVDLSKLEAGDVTISPDGKSITVRLPPAEIFSRTLNNDKTRVYSRDRGFFAPDNPELESQARQVAETEILRAACEDNILQKASDEGQRAVQQLFGLAEFQQVNVIATPPAPCAAPAQ
jgi:hypothetical protein